MAVQHFVEATGFLGHCPTITNSKWYRLPTCRLSASAQEKLINSHLINFRVARTRTTRRINVFMKFANMISDGEMGPFTYFIDPICITTNAANKIDDRQQAILFIASAWCGSGERFCCGRPIRDAKKAKNQICFRTK